MKLNIVNTILSLPTVGLHLITDPSENHPDNDLYYEMKKKGIITIKGTEEGGIIAVGLTVYGQKLQKELKHKE